MKKAAILVLLLYLLLYILPLGVRPMFQPDETRYAEIAREMLASGDFVSPRLNALRYFEKPVFGYWLFAGSMKLFGDNSFALRLPCALAAALAALSIFLTVRRFAGSATQALLAAAIFLSMPLVYFIGNLGILDSILTGLLTTATCLFLFALEEKGSWLRKAAYLAAGGAVCGLAFMTKGFLAFAAPALTICAFLAWERRWKDFLATPWIPALAAFLVALPWALAMHRAEPSFWHYFFWVEHIQRFTSNAATQHEEPFWFFLPILLGGAATWVLAMPAAFSGLRATGISSPFMKFCICWLAMPFIFFSASSGKLPPYILPCFAPLAILMAAGLHKCAESGWTKAIQFAMLPLACALGAALPLFVINQASGFPITLYGEGETLKWIAGALAAALTLSMLILGLREQRAIRKLAFLCVAFLPPLFTYNFIVPEMLIERKAPVEFLARNIDLLEGSGALVSWRDPAQSLAWTARRNDIWLYLSGGEMDDGLKFQDSKHRLLSNETLSRMIYDYKDKGGVALVLPEDIYWEEEENLPPPKRLVSSSDSKHAYAIVIF